MGALLPGTLCMDDTICELVLYVSCVNDSDNTVSITSLSVREAFSHDHGIVRKKLRADVRNFKPDVTFSWWTKNLACCPLHNKD